MDPYPHSCITDPDPCLALDPDPTVIFGGFEDANENKFFLEIRSFFNIQQIERQTKKLQPITSISFGFKSDTTEPVLNPDPCPSPTIKLRIIYQDVLVLFTRFS